MDYYPTSLEHILAELERIDVLIRVQVWRAQQVQVAADQLQGFYISEQEVEALLSQPVGLPRWATIPLPPSMSEVQDVLNQLAQGINQRKAMSTQQGVKLRLDELADHFQLTPFDIDVLLIALAPEIDLRYERLYAYLQDDMNRKQSSVDLALNLLCPSLADKMAARSHFTSQSPLFNHQLIHLITDPTQQQPPSLSKSLKIDERVVSYLLDVDDRDARLLPIVRHCQPQVKLQTLLLPVTLKERLLTLVQMLNVNGAADKQPDRGLVLYFQGSYGVGKQMTAEALCGELGLGLLVVDGVRLLQAKEVAFETAVHLAGREAFFQNAALYWTGFDALLADDNRSCLESLLREVENRQGLTFLAGETAWEPADALTNQPFMRIEFARPSHAERVQLWMRALNGNAAQGNESATDATQTVDLGALATKFRFSGGQIRDAAATAVNLARWRDPLQAQVNMADLYRACRLQSNRKLATLAQKITPHYGWNDIVLPPDRLAQLREICNQVKYRTLVYDHWGFDRKLATSKGLNALFTGPSGTGKTMAAEIIAGALGLDLYKIDLSTVVSKYIGETEKNLSHIFAEAEASNAILFFDEADALFGKRSEVRDAHDRYANIETSYLLQRMETYEGVVILATNLRKNMDEAFVRRLHFTVEFPFPNEQERACIWHKIWPAELPRRPDLDLAFMARRFEFTGGNIRNIALAAAFLAADEGSDLACDGERGDEGGNQIVSMAHLIQATQREYQKIGKVVTEREFGEYAAYVR